MVQVALSIFTKALIIFHFLFQMSPSRLCLAALARLPHCHRPFSQHALQMPASELCLFRFFLLECSSPSQALLVCLQVSSAPVSCREHSPYDSCAPGVALSASYGLRMTSTCICFPATCQLLGEKKKIGVTFLYLS